MSIFFLVAVFLSSSSNAGRISEPDTFGFDVILEDRLRRFDARCSYKENEINMYKKIVPGMVELFKKRH